MHHIYFRCSAPIIAIVDGTRQSSQAASMKDPYYLPIYLLIYIPYLPTYLPTSLYVYYLCYL